MIILSTAFSVYLLARTLRRSLEQAQSELAQRKIIEEQLRYHSLYDLMTGVYNRNYFEQELQRLESGRSYPVSVVVADLDGLKSINDTVGHAAESIVQRIHSRVEEYHRAHGATPIRLSIGTATAEKKDLLDAFMQADRRMYEDKAKKREKTP
jgi:GGDEF domain-containing protein